MLKPAELSTVLNPTPKSYRAVRGPEPTTIDRAVHDPQLATSHEVSEDLMIS